MMVSVEKICLLEDFFFNPCGKSDQLIVHLNIAKKWLSEAKLKTRSDASRQNISNFHF